MLFYSTKIDHHFSQPHKVFDMLSLALSLSRFSFFISIWQRLQSPLKSCKQSRQAIIVRERYEMMANKLQHKYEKSTQKYVSEYERLSAQMLRFGYGFSFAMRNKKKKKKK